MFEARVSRVFGIFAGVLAVLAVQAFALQVVRKDKITSEHEARVHRRFILTPRRGDILWKDGTPAATDEPGYAVTIDPTAYEAPRWRCAVCGTVTRAKSPPKSCAECRAEAAQAMVPTADPAELARVLGVAFDEVARAFERATLEKMNAPRIGVYTLLPRVSREAAQAFQLASARFPGVAVRAVRRRVVDPVASGMVGVTRPAWQEDVDELTDESRRAEGERVYFRSEVYAMRFGLRGLEKQFDDRLRGEPGRAFRLPRKDGLVQPPRIERPVLDGDAVRTSLRRNVQIAADEIVALAPGDAAAVVLDLSDGGVAAIASQSHDLLNHAVCGIRPGSVFKLVTALALLEAGVPPEETVFCDRRGPLPSGRRYVCDEHHGAMDLRDAFAHSCNAYFETMAERIGPGPILGACRELGLDTSPRLHLAGTPGGIGRMLGRSGRFAPSDLRFLGKGQDRALATPLQIAVAYARVATGGRRIVPYVVDEEAAGAADVDPSIARFSQVLRDGARRCVTIGTGNKIRELTDVAAAGKSGTGDTNAGGTLNNAWFVAYAPYDNPRFVAVVVFEKVPGFGAETVGPHVGRLLAEAMR